jgi:hypothetical protein
VVYFTAFVAFPVVTLAGVAIGRALVFAVVRVAGLATTIVSTPTGLDNDGRRAAAQSIGISASECLVFQARSHATAAARRERTQQQTTTTQKQELLHNRFPRREMGLPVPSSTRPPLMALSYLTMQSEILCKSKRNSGMRVCP